jgi:hypothetical protein
LRGDRNQSGLCWLSPPIYSSRVQEATQTDFPFPITLIAESGDTIKPEEAIKKTPKLHFVDSGLLAAL